MDWTAVVEALALPVTGVASVAWYGFTRLSSRLTGAERAISDYKLYVAQTYVTSGTLETAISNFNRSVEAIFKKLDRIGEKLDQKADK